MNYDDWTHIDDVWLPSSKSCPTHGPQTETNGKIVQCKSCGWWQPL